MQLKGLLYRKLVELTKARKKEQEKIEKEHVIIREDIDKESDEIVEEIQSLIKNDTKRSEQNIDEKFDRILKNLDVLNKLNRIQVQQNQSIIGMLKKKRKVIVSL